jgi:hypothetical protein
LIYAPWTILLISPYTITDPHNFLPQKRSTSPNLTQTLSFLLILSRQNSEPRFLNYLIYNIVDLQNVQFFFWINYQISLCLCNVTVKTKNPSPFSTFK